MNGPHDAERGDGAAMTKTILLVEEFPHLAAGFTFELGSDADGTAPYAVDHRGDASSAVAQVSPGSYDAALVDLTLPDRTGLWVIEQLRRLDDELPICALHSGEEDPWAALNAGARGVISKRVGTELKPLVNKLVNGFEEVFDPVASELLLRRRRAEDNVRTGRLTPRELDVLQLMAEGSTAEGIGRVLNLSSHTVKDNQKKLYQKLRVSDKAHAVTQGFRLGLLS